MQVVATLLMPIECTLMKINSPSKKYVTRGKIVFTAGVGILALVTQYRHGRSASLNSSHQLLLFSYCVIELPRKKKSSFYRQRML